MIELLPFAFIVSIMTGANIVMIKNLIRQDALENHWLKVTRDLIDDGFIISLTIQSHFPQFLR
jgi:hypothetical protein